MTNLKNCKAGVKIEKERGKKGEEKK